MTNSEKNRAEKKADTALCKLQDLFYGYNIPESVAYQLNQACDKVRDVISAINEVQATRKSKV